LTSFETKSSSQFTLIRCKAVTHLPTIKSLMR
jgi:hypothetical protein